MMLMVPSDRADPVSAAACENDALRARVEELEQLLADRPTEPEGEAHPDRVALRLLGEAERVAHTGGWMWEAGVNEVRWSDGLFRIVGVAPGSIVLTANTLLERAHADDRERLRQATLRGLSSGVFEAVQFRIVRPDLDVRHVAMDGEYTFDDEGRLQRAVATVLDVTHPRESALELVRTAELLAEAQRIGRMGSFEVDVETLQTTWSEGLYRVLDVDPGAPPSFQGLLGRLHQDDRDRVVGAVSRAFVQGVVEPVRARLSCQDGSTRHLDLTAISVIDPATRARLLRGTITDISKLVMLEAQFHASQRMEAVGQLAGGLAHDFNNWLMVIAGNAAELAQHHQSPQLLEILEATEAATDLTRRLLAFGRDDRRTVRSIYLEDEAGRSLDLVRRALGEMVVLRTEIQSTPFPVLAETGQLQQMLLNLALNARDAMPDGGTFTMSVRVARLDAEQAMSFDVMPDDYLVLTVSDTGIGMDEATRARVFEPFFTTKAAGVGTGLGLAMVFGAMRRCGGLVRVSSKPQQGARFELWFPRAPVEPHAFRFEARVATRARAAKVMFVEDNPRVAKVVKSMLEAGGYSVRAAASPNEALSAWSEAPADVLVTDVEMPGMNGYRLREQLLPHHPELRTIFITGRSTGRFDQLSTAVNTLLLIKPFTQEELLAALEKVLGDPQDTTKSPLR